MMLLPFLTLAAAVAFTLAGRRSSAVTLWAFSLAWTLLLFRLHASDSLALAF